MKNPRSHRTKRNQSPGMGERRALGGYHPQLLIASSLILTSLNEGTLNWIRLADPDAGWLDDFQIGADHRVDAYQIKWSRYPGNFSFRDLTRSSARSPSLIEQLADGWKKLGAKRPGHRTVVHLVTNERPS